MVNELEAPSGSTKAPLNRTRPRRQCDDCNQPCRHYQFTLR